MKKKILIGSIIAVALLTLVSFSSAVGKVSLEPVPDLDCAGDLYWVDVIPGATITDSFTVENIGDDGSLLNWEIQSYPDWGNWTFDPEYGIGLTPESGAITIEVEFVMPDIPENDLWDEIKIVNLENSSDYCIIDVFLKGESVPDIEVLEEDNVNPIALLFQLITKLRDNKEIQELVVDNGAEVDIQKEISNIVERDEELNSIFEQLSVEDCGCDDNSILGGSTSVLCWILVPFIFLGILLIPIGTLFIDLLGVIGDVLNCFWFPF